jgi:hypothetical protein
MEKKRKKERTKKIKPKHLYIQISVFFSFPGRGALFFICINCPPHACWYVYVYVYTLIQIQTELSLPLALDNNQYYILTSEGTYVWTITGATVRHIRTGTHPWCG